jgi:hypothetical protein
LQRRSEPGLSMSPGMGVLDEHLSQLSPFSGVAQLSPLSRVVIPARQAIHRMDTVPAYID